MKKVLAGMGVICLATCILFTFATIGYNIQANAHAEVNIEAYEDYDEGKINWTDFQFKTTHYGILANINHALYNLCLMCACSMAIACIIFFVLWLSTDENKKKE